MTAGVILLGAYGKIDMFISYKPQITFFKAVFKRHTYFSQELIDQYFITSPNFDTQTSCIVFNNADLISDLYLAVSLPAIPQSFNFNTSTIDKEVAYKWIDYIGFNLIKSINIEISNKVIQTIDSDWLYNYYNLYGFRHRNSDGDHERSIKKLVGQVPSLVEYSDKKEMYNLIIPIPFWFCTSPGLALPLNALNFSEVKINLQISRQDDVLLNGPTNYVKVYESVCFFKKYEYIYQGSNTIGIFFYFDAEKKLLYFNTIQGNFVPSVLSIEKELVNGFQHNNLIRNSDNFFIKPIDNVQNKKILVKSILNLSSCKLVANYIYLENSERIKFYKSTHQYLIEQQQYYLNTNIISYNNRLLLNFVNPCFELIWYLRYNNNLKNKILYVTTDNADGSGSSLIKKCGLVFNGNDILSKRNHDFTEIVELFTSHTNTKLKGISVYRFGLNPEINQPSGSCNMSRIEKAYLDIVTSPNISYTNKATLKIIARGYNILQISNGTIQILFES